MPTFYLTYKIFDFLINRGVHGAFSVSIALAFVIAVIVSIWKFPIFRLVYFGLTTIALVLITYSIARSNQLDAIWTIFCMIIVAALGSMCTYHLYKKNLYI